MSFRSNNLLSDYNLTKWSDFQQKTHDLIKSLHDDGMGFRKIAKHLNELGIKTIRGNEWKNTTVFSVLKRNRERLNRLEVGELESEIEFGKLELVWMKD